MAKILYGIAGEGFGHGSRSELMGRRLLEAGHEVLFAASRKSLHYLQQCFPKRVCEVYGLSFVYREGRVHSLATAWQNIRDYRKGLGVNRGLFRNQVRSFRPDCVISDFEPFCSWWAWRNRIPCVSIDHEHMLTMQAIEPIANHRKGRVMAQMVTRCYHARADAYIILNFFKSPLKNPRAVLTPPVVRDVVQKVAPWAGVSSCTALI